MAHKQSTAQPPKRISLNEWYKYIYDQNKKLAKRSK